MSTPAQDTLSALRTDIVRAVREHTGLHERLAVPIAEDILAAVRQRFGGQRIYVPSAQTAQERAEAIRSLLDCGHDPQTVARLTGLSRATVYRAARGSCGG